MENTMPRQSETFRDLWQLVALVGIALLLVTVALWMILSQSNLFSDRGIEQDPLGVSQTAFAAETGIQIKGVAMIAGGGIIDLRYQVVDPDKAVIVHDEENPPSFIVEATGQVVNTPYHEHSIFEAHTGVTYHELIMNPGGVLKPGTEISVLIGESRLEHVVIQ